MRNEEAQAFSVAVLALSRAVVDGVDAGTRARGFDDIRPLHGFAFTRLARGDATVTDLAEHLDVTRQAAAQIVDDLVAKGYVVRRPHPADGRARLVQLTQKGWACTRAAEAAMTEVIQPWAAELGEERTHDLLRDLLRIAPPGPVRPSW